MLTGALGKVYQDGETIIHQGAQEDCIYVIQEGKVEVFEVVNGREIHLAELGEGDFFGEMAVFEQTVRSTSVRALGQARVLTVDKRTLLRRMHEDPSLSFRILQIMSSRIRGLDAQMARLGWQQPGNEADSTSWTNNTNCSFESPSRMDATVFRPSAVLG